MPESNSEEIWGGSRRRFVASILRGIAHGIEDDPKAAAELLKTVIELLDPTEAALSSKAASPAPTSISQPTPALPAQIRPAIPPLANSLLTNPVPILPLSARPVPTHAKRIKMTSPEIRPPLQAPMVNIELPVPPCPVRLLKPMLQSPPPQSSPRKRSSFPLLSPSTRLDLADAADPLRAYPSSDVPRPFTRRGGPNIGSSSDVHTILRQTAASELSARAMIAKRSIRVTGEAKKRGAEYKSVLEYIFHKSPPIDDMGVSIKKENGGEDENLDMLGRSRPSRKRGLESTSSGSRSDGRKKKKMGGFIKRERLDDEASE